MSDDDIFERAARAKLRFPSAVGMLTTEELWDLPLKALSVDRPCLDEMAREVFAELRSVGAGPSFVDDRPDPRRSELELALEVVKRVIEVKKNEAARAERSAQNAQRRRKLLDALAAKDDQALAGMSREEIQAEIEKLGEAT